MSNTCSSQTGAHGWGARVKCPTYLVYRMTRLCVTMAPSNARTTATRHMSHTYIHIHAVCIYSCIQNGRCMHRNTEMHIQHALMNTDGRRGSHKSLLYHRPRVIKPEHKNSLIMTIRADKLCRMISCFWWFWWSVFLNTRLLIQFTCTSAKFRFSVGIVQTDLHQICASFYLPWTKNDVTLAYVSY